MKIGFDAMGGDYAPLETVKGAVESLPLIGDAGIVLFGKETEIRQELQKYTYDKNRIEIVHAEEVVEGEDKPVFAIRTKPNSSMVLGLKALRKREIDAFVSAGNTGALLAGGLVKVGRIKGVSRPAIVTIYPTMSAPSILVDAGANAECKVENLYEFAVMGCEYAKVLLGMDRPTVGLVNIGAEETKGTPLYQESYRFFKESNLNFVGNVEGRNIPEGKVNVLVADGFTGNIILKLTEGVAMSLVGELRSMFRSGLLTKLSALLMKRQLSQFKKKLDYTEYGGAPILGIDGLVVKAHGSSNAKAFSNAIKYAYLGVERDIVHSIRTALSNHAPNGSATESKMEYETDETN